MKEICILNIYQLNIYNILTLVFKVKNGSKTDVFHDRFHLILLDYLRKKTVCIILRNLGLAWK